MKFYLSRFLLGLLLLSSQAIAADTNKITTLAITQDTLKAVNSCLQYKVTGICFWLECHGVYCTVNETLKVDHYLPDAVVSIFRKNDSSPWDYANAIVDPFAETIGNEQVKNILGFNMGFGNENVSSPKTQDNHFKEADLIGNPAINIFNEFHNYLLPSQATPFMPYYLSMADAYMWRSPLIEMALYPSSWLPGVHIVGSMLNNWGAVYPRTGLLNQPADAKAAAVLAQRSADIATQDQQPHVYQVLNSDSCGDHCYIDATAENSPNTQWQMVYPIAETQCAAFGENDLNEQQPWHSDAAKAGQGNYVWVLWRHYHGCIQGFGKYIGSIDFAN